MLHPSDAPRAGAPESERRVYEALAAHLPAGWHAYHSLRIRTDRGFLGEGDFVIADPRRGFLVLEVKGGRIEQRDGHWLQNGRRMERPPLEQALGFAHRLARRIEAMHGERPPFGAAVCFPDLPFETPPGQDDLARVTLGARELPYLGEVLPGIFDAAIPKGRVPRGSRWLTALRTLWGETWVPHLSLGRRAEEGRKRWYALDETQVAILEGLRGNARVLVEGPAGSGKTLLAAACARRHAEEGLATELLCFTGPLQAYLARALPEGVRVETVGAAALRVLSVATGERIEVEGRAQAFWEGLYLRAADAVGSLPASERPEMLVVDEAQDLSENAWFFVDALAGAGRLWAFGDGAQRFWPERTVPEELFPTRFALPASHRCPKGLLALARRCIGQPADETAIEAALGDGTLGLRPCPSETSVPEYVARAIDDLLGEGLKPEDLFVVSLRGREAPGSILRARTLGRHRPVPADDPAAPHSLVADTFLRVKGLERPAVIVTDLHLLDSDAGQGAVGVRMHIALTRALLTARIVAPRPALQAIVPWPP
ncbi:MAG: hypothetical protein D6729_13365 [Deltaproteobacteria bacterium]|nr:MAG: hypothetical protein D6729_13365 [Deltaproteobacteria bacterium]